jgi:MFS transporter, FHS family, L-fucose permease
MKKTRSPHLLPAIALVISLFFLWGVANNLNDVLVAHFRQAFSLSDLQSGLVQSAFYLGYFVFALPAGMFGQRFGYKGAVVFGLLLYGVGALLFYPAAEARVYGAFLAALFVVASGLAFLETSASPLMAALGAPEGAARRLNLAAAFNPLGSITGVLVGRMFILSSSAADPRTLSPAALAGFRTAQARSVEGPYLVLGIFVMVWAAVVAATRFPPEAGRAPPQARGARGAGEVLKLLAHWPLMFGVVAQFCYVGAQVGVWSFLIRYARHALPSLGDRAASDYLTLSLVIFTIGRFAGAALLTRVRPARLLGVFAACAATLCAAAALVGGAIGLTALVGVSFFMSVMYPTIFAGAIADLGAATKLGASFLVMSIVGGAVWPALMGRISDLSSISTAMLAPGGAFIVVLAFAALGPHARRVAVEGAVDIPAV